MKTEDTVNAQTVLEWIDAIKAAFPEAQKITVYVDNTRYFHAKLVTAPLIGKRVRFISLPLYSPNLNLIERLRKFRKKKVLSIYYNTFKEFMKAVDDLFSDLLLYKEGLATLMEGKFEKNNCRYSCNFPSIMSCAKVRSSKGMRYQGGISTTFLQKRRHFVSVDLLWKLNRFPVRLLLLLSAQY